MKGVGGVSFLYCINLKYNVIGMIYHPSFFFHTMHMDWMDGFQVWRTWFNVRNLLSGEINNFYRENGFVLISLTAKRWAQFRKDNQEQHQIFSSGKFGPWFIKSSSLSTYRLLTFRCCNSSIVAVIKVAKGNKSKV